MNSKETEDLSQIANRFVTIYATRPMRTKNSELLKPILALDVFSRFLRVFHFGNSSASFKESTQKKLDEYLEFNQISEFELSLFDLRSFLRLGEQVSYENLSFPLLEAQAYNQKLALEKLMRSQHLQRFFNEFSGDGVENLGLVQRIKWKELCKEFIQYLNDSRVVLESAFKSQPELCFSYRDSNARFMDEVENDIKNNDSVSDFRAHFRL